MLISILANGDIRNIVTENIYQGSNDANTIYVVAPFSANVQAFISFEIATTGQVIEPILLDSPTIIANELNVWKVNIAQALTQFYGEVKFQIKFVNNSQIIATASGKFKVKEGVDFELPPSPDEVTYTAILSKLSDIEAHYLNGWIEAQSLKVYNTEFAYSQNSFIFGEQEGKVYLFRSLKENNKGNDLTDVESWEKIELGVSTDINTVLTELNKIISGQTVVGKALNDSDGNKISEFYATKQELRETNGRVLLAETNIEHIIDGTEIAGKAERDASGNKFEDSYINKTNIVTGWSAEPSNYNVPSEKLVKDAITGIIAGSGGGNVDLVFDTYAQFLSWIDGRYTRPDGKTTNDLTIGTGILIKEANTSDYWCSSLSKPFTINNFTPFEVSINLDNYLAKDNIDAYTPTSSYNPATKKYVDDAVNEIIDGDKVVMEAEMASDFVEGGAIDQELTGQRGAIENIIKGAYISSGFNIDITKTDNGVTIVGASDFIEIDQPETATQGNLEAEDVALLQANPDAYILFAKEKYVLNGKEHTSGYLTYTNSEYESGETRIRTITIILSNLTWNLQETVVASKTYVDNLVGDIDTVLTALNTGSGV